MLKWTVYFCIKLTSAVEIYSGETPSQFIEGGYLRERVQQYSGGRKLVMGKIRRHYCL